MTVAVIGCGSIGRRHIGNLLDLGCGVVAHDVDASLVLRDDWPADCEFAKAIDLASVDAVIIATPYDQHLSWVACAVDCGVPFFVEKPLGSLEQLPQWRAIAAMKLPVNQVGFNLRFHATAQALKLLFPNPLAGWFSCHVDMSTWPGKDYGSYLLEAGSHEIDLALWLGARGDVAFRRETVYIGGHWSLRISEASPCFRSWDYFRSWGIEQGVKFYEAEFHSPEELGTEMYRAEMAHFLDCVKAQKPTLCPLADGLRVLEVVAQIEAVTKAPA